MSMLSEPRRKQRIGPNPRGKFFAEENNFGKALLRRMGWENGDGLGLDKQGISEALRPKFQMSSKGLGYDIKSDPWVTHNLEFEEILKNLQGTLPNEVAKTALPAESMSDDDDHKQKLEKKSRSSRARIHYHKFVKGKDLSRASSSDLKSIFGNTEDINTKTDPIGSVIVDTTLYDNKEDGNTINKGSMVDYFQQKMEEKRQVLHGKEIILTSNSPNRAVVADESEQGKNETQGIEKAVKNEKRRLCDAQKNSQTLCSPESCQHDSLENPMTIEPKILESGRTTVSDSRILTLEERLREEMENIKKKRQLKRQEYFSSLPTISKKFKGSNIQKINGYSLY